MAGLVAGLVAGVDGVLTTLTEVLEDEELAGGGEVPPDGGTPHWPRGLSPGSWSRTP